MKYEPRHVYVVSFDDANTDLKYFCSHRDQILEGVSAADIYYGDIVNASTNTQGLDPIRANATIGGINFTIMDTNGTISALLNAKLLAGDGLRGKRVQHWLGERGGEWTSEYTQIQTHQIHNAIKVVNDGGAYQFKAKDIQRTTLKNIFILKKTNTTAAITRSDITLNVNSTTGFALLQHGASYGDAPNKEVVYVQIKDEIIRCSAIPTTSTFTVDNEQSTLNGAVLADAVNITVTDASLFNGSGVGYIDDGAGGITEIKWEEKSGNILQKVTGVATAQTTGWTIVAANGRGALGTVTAAYEYDISSADRNKVTEHIYYELPAQKLAYALLTGSLYGSADVIPAHHHLGISTDWISTSQFTQYADDIWDPADDAQGIILRFSGLKKTNAKKFIEEELNFWCGVYNIILPNGELGLKRMTGVISDAAYSGGWNESNVISVSNARYDLNDVHNTVSIDWNFNPLDKEFSRNTQLADSDSQARWGESKTLELRSKGLHGSRHTDSVLIEMFNTWRDRYAGPPFKATINLDYTQRHVKVGDIKRLTIDTLPEFTDQDGNYSSTDMAVEIQKIRFNPTNGTVSCDVFGSTYKSVALELTTVDASPADDTWFTAVGTNLNGCSTIASSVGGGILTITSGSLTGSIDLSGSEATTDNEKGIFYFDGDVNINGQVNIDKNVELRINGFITFNASGFINGKGNGTTAGLAIPTAYEWWDYLDTSGAHAALPGEAGAIGNTQQMGGVALVADGVVCSPGLDPIIGTYPSMPSFQITNDGGQIGGTPRDLRGSSGTGGSAIGPCLVCSVPIWTKGGDGGGGGAGFVLFCKGAAGQAGSKIDLSGDDGQIGSQTRYHNLQWQTATGGGGAAGGFFMGMASGTLTETLSNYFVANDGDTLIIGTPLTQERDWGWNYASSLQQPICSHFVGLPGGVNGEIGNGGYGQDKSLVNFKKNLLPNDVVVEADAPIIVATGTLMAFTENSNVPQTPAENLATVDVTITPPIPVDGYSHSIIKYKVATDGDATYQQLPFPAADETTVVISMDGTEYTFRAYSVSVDGIQSGDFIQNNFTVSTSAGGVELATGNYIRTTAAPATSGGVVLDNTGLLGYDSGGTVINQVDGDGATIGQISAMDANISTGGITLSAGGALKSTGKTVGSGAGVYLGYDTSAYKLDVGDHDTEKFIYFDGTDLILGKNTEIIGTDTYNTDNSVYLHMIMADASVTETITGTATITRPTGYGKIQVNATKSYNALIRKNHQLGIQNVQFFERVRRFKTTISTIPDGLDTATNAWVGVKGYILDGNKTHGYGFKILNDKMYGVVFDGGVENITTLSGSTAMTDFSKNWSLEAVNDAGTTCKYYINNILVGTESVAADVPDAATNGDRVLYVELDDDGTTTDTGGAAIVHSIELGEWFFIQEVQ